MNDPRVGQQCVCCERPLALVKDGIIVRREAAFQLVGESDGHTVWVCNRCGPEKVEEWLAGRSDRR
jgi:Zn-finger protein